MCRPTRWRWKKNESPQLLSERFDLLLGATAAATITNACAQRLAQHMLATLLIAAHSTVTNLICTSGGQHQDWTAHYRLYSKDRVEESALFGRALREAVEHLPPGAPVVFGMDDTIVRKSGTHIHGSGWKRDPLGPPFQTNLVCSQRYLQCSIAWPLAGLPGEARMIPVDFRHAPSPAKSKANTGPADQAAYREQLKQRNLNPGRERPETPAQPRRNALQHQLTSLRHHPT